MATSRRFVVNNIGHAYAVHDTQRTYQRMEGEERGGAAPTSNVYNFNKQCGAHDNNFSSSERSVSILFSSFLKLAMRSTGFSYSSSS